MKKGRKGFDNWGYASEAKTEELNSVTHSVPLFHSIVILRKPSKLRSIKALFALFDV
jgi:hypothetical protein